MTLNTPGVTTIVFRLASAAPGAVSRLVEGFGTDRLSGQQLADIIAFLRTLP